MLLAQKAPWNTLLKANNNCALIIIITIIMYIYHVFLNALSTHIIHINLKIIFFTHAKHSPTKTIYIKYYMETHTHTHTRTHTHTHTHTQQTNLQ